MPIKIASWNVNSIKARQDHVARWLDKNQPDLLMIQELKGTEFPFSTFENSGYEIEVNPQKAYNGVAIFSKEKQTVITKNLPRFEEDEQARYLEIDYEGVRYINIYAPNGNPTGTEKYDYKIKWLDILIEHLKHLREQRIPFLITGDFNIIPEDIDCHDPTAWADDALALPTTIQRWHSMLNLGLTDAYRIFDKSDEKYSFWDYQAGAWPQNKGIRIDHFLLSPTLTDRAVSCVIDKEPRGEDKPSDHTPIILELADA